jgi:cytochrome c-type biogenesis protein CcmH/NrfG
VRGWASTLEGRSLRYRPLLVLLVILVPIAPIAVAARPRARGAADSLATARTLTRWGWDAVADPAIESRQRAIRDLKEAIRLDPGNAEPWLALGRAYELGDYGELARDCYRRSIILAPRQPDGFMELGMAWKREFLRTLGRTSLDHAIGAFDTVALLRPYGADGWLRLAPLRYERGDLAGAAVAAERALAGRPRRPATPLAAACFAYRRGEIERADSLFVTAIPRLDPTLRALFEKPAWIGLRDAGAPEGGAAPGGPAPGGARDPWAGLDPDPTTPQNEARLEYWSRVAHAYLLFFDPLRPELDARAEIYVRYGPPAKVELNPVGVATTFKYDLNPSKQGSGTAEYPLDALVWSYPDLGMRVVLHDRSLTGRYTTAATRSFDPLSVPDPRVLAKRGDLLSLGGGQFILSTRPPRDQRLEVEGLVARFESDGRPRLVAQVQAAGGPGDTLWARWVVLDRAGSELARGTRELALSACDPVARRVTEFSSTLGAGAFQVVVSVRDAQRRRGLFRDTLALAPVPRGLALSDVVLACGEPALMVSGSAVRLEANIAGRIAGRQPLVAYFEIYRLAADGDGLARFEYEYTVRRVPKAQTGLAKLFVLPEAPVVSATSREAVQVGTLRRQFVSIPAQSLVPGRYRLEIRVRDLLTGAEVKGATEFVRE